MQHLSQPQADNYVFVDEGDGVHGRVSAAASLCFVWRRRLGSYHSQPLLGGRGKPKNATHGTATAIKLSLKP